MDSRGKKQNGFPFGHIVVKQQIIQGNEKHVKSSQGKSGKIMYKRMTIRLHADL